MVYIEIVRSSKQRFWYDSYVGFKYKLIRDFPEDECWLVVSNDGYSNIVRYTDGKIV